MLKSFPAYEKELLLFIEITPEIARRNFKWLCSKPNSETAQECGDRLLSYFRGTDDKFKCTSEYIMCGKSSNPQDREENFKRYEKKLESFSRRNSKRTIKKGDKEMPDEKKVEPKLEEWLEKWFEKDNELEDNAPIKGVEVLEEV